MSITRTQPVNLTPGTIVQVVKPAKDGTRCLIGMLGIVASGEAPDIPDPNGAHVTFKWHDGTITGAIARDRLRVVGETDPPAADDIGDPDDDHEITVADPAELREVYRKALDIAEEALNEYGRLFARFNTLRESAGLALDGGEPRIVKLRAMLAKVIEQVKPGEGRPRHRGRVR